MQKKPSSSGTDLLPDPAGIPLFSGLSVLEDVKGWCPSAFRQVWDSKAAIYLQGDACPDLFVLLRGQVKLARVDETGREFTMGLLAPGDLFGPGLTGETAPTAQESALAKGPAVLWRVPSREFQCLLLRQRDVSLRVVQMLARRQQQVERRLASTVFKRTEARLAETLRELSGGFEARCEHGFGQHLRITQQELADLVGASRPVVSSLLNRLREEGVLGYSRDYLCVRSIEAIERLGGD